MAASIRSVLRVVVFAHMALMHTYQELSTCTYSLQEIKYFWWSHVTARISLDLPTFLQMAWNMAQRHQTLRETNVWPQSACKVHAGTIKTLRQEYM